MKINWTDEMLATAKKMIDDGASFGEAAAAINVSRSAMIGKSRRMGWISARPAKRPPTYSDEDFRRYVDLLQSGYSYKGAAVALGVGVDAMMRRARAAGIPPGTSITQNRNRQREIAKRNASRTPTPVLSPVAWMAMRDRFKDGYCEQTGRVALVDLKGNQCRYPIEMETGQTLFCGLHTPDDSSWCESHAPRVFNRQRP